MHTQKLGITDRKHYNQQPLPAQTAPPNISYQALYMNTNTTWQDHEGDTLVWAPIHTLNNCWEILFFDINSWSVLHQEYIYSSFKVVYLKSLHGVDTWSAPDSLGCTKFTMSTGYPSGGNFELLTTQGRNGYPRSRPSEGSYKCPVLCQNICFTVPGISLENMILIIVIVHGLNF